MLVKAIRYCEGFNALSDRQRMHLLFEVCSSPIWARRVLAAAPFRDTDALYDRADRVLAELPDAEIDAALDGHPRIGAGGGTTRPRLASRRQVADADDAVQSRTGREEPRVRGQVRLRLPGVRQRTHGRGTAGHPQPTAWTTTRSTERRVMRNELAKINRLRLERLVSEPV